MRRFLIIGGLGLLAICVAIGLNFWLIQDAEKVSDTDKAQPRVPAPPSPSARGSGIPVPSPPPVAAYRPGAPDKPGTASDDQGKADDAGKATGPIKPSFDVVRINPEGDAVIAGRAAPGAKVTILDGDKQIGSATADDRGEWVFLPTEPLPTGKRELGLMAAGPNGETLVSDSVVVLAVPERPGAAAAPESRTAQANPGSSKEAKPTETISGPLAVLVPRDGQGPSRVLQKPTEKGGVRKGDLSIGVVDYDDAGNVSIGGTAKPGEDVQVYLDNKLVGRAEASPEGEWRVEPKDKVSPGIYKLRADAIASGRVTARVEIPFSRAERVAGLEGESLVIVQPGNSLWRIARRILGSGTKYTMIYDANKAQILDPDLIYPGQVFALPRTN